MKLPTTKILPNLQGTRQRGGDWTTSNTVDSIAITLRSESSSINLFSGTDMIFSIHSLKVRSLIKSPTLLIP